MSEGSRQFNQKPKPVISLDIKSFPFVSKLQYGAKGELDIAGIIVRERKEDDSIVKVIKIARSTPIKQKRAK